MSNFEKELEHAAKDIWARGVVYRVGGEITAKDYADAFKEGAAWMKEQLMKRAVEGEVENPEPMSFRVASYELPTEFITEDHIAPGDLVKLIIMPWED